MILVVQESYLYSLFAVMGSALHSRLYKNRVGATLWAGRVGEFLQRVLVAQCSFLNHYKVAVVSEAPGISTIGLISC